MKTGVLFTAVFAVALSTAAVASSAEDQSAQLDVQTAELLDRISGGVQQVSFDSASTLEFSGGDLQSAGQKAKGCCDSCCPIWVGGVEATFLRPHIHGARYQGSIAEVEGVRVDSRDFAFDEMTFAPRVWLGKQGECWGVLTRFWYLSDSNMVQDPYLGAANNDYRASTAGNRIKAYTIDLEVNRRLTYRCWDMNFGVGLRHASLSYDTMASQDVFGDPAISPDVDILSSAFTKSRIDATGLTIGLDGRQLVWPCRNLSAFWGVRGSFLLGDSSYNGYAAGSVVDSATPAADTDVVANFADVDADLFIGEIQLGLLWEQRLSCLPANVFVKIAAEYQYWAADRNVPLWNGASPSTGGGPGTFFANPQFDSVTPSASFFGFNLGVGLTWGGCCDSCYAK